MFKYLKNIFLYFLVLVFLFPWSGVLAEEDCGTLEECQALLDKYEQEIFQHETNLDQNKAEQKTLNNKIYSLRNRINQLSADIKKSTIIITDLEVQVEDTQVSIVRTSNEIEGSKQKLVEILRAISKEDQKTTLGSLLEGDDPSDFFENLVSLENLLVRNRDILSNIKSLKSDLEEQEIVLGEEKTDWERMKQIQLLQQQEDREVKSEQEWLLNQTKGQEAVYQELLATSRAKASEIRSRIFKLIGVTDAPTFGEALEIARYVEGLTGVRPAFLLAVLTQESNIGQNVGQCYLRNSETGAGISIRTGQALNRVMKPSRDVGPFLTICSETGRDPYNTRVSCPMSFGYGGAMGPAQFIPSTWMMYRNTAKQILGRPADPWIINDAFLMAGILLQDSGAASQTYNGEWRAAMIYFSGGTNSKYSFYGNSVMAIAKQYDQDIAALEGF